MTRTRYGTPLWMDRSPRSRRLTFERLKGSTNAEVVVVGGGLTGCMTACVLARAGVSVVLVEAERVAESAGRDAGWIHESPGPSFRQLQDAYGRRAARQIWSASRRSALELAAFLRRLQIRCDLSPRLGVQVATSEDQVRDLRKELQARTDAGIEAAWLPGTRVAKEVRADNVRAAIKTRHEGIVDPYRGCVGLTRAAAQAGATCFDRSPVRRIKTGRRSVEVQTEAGAVTAQTVIIATGAPRPLVPALQRHVRVEDAYIVATPMLPAALQRLLPRDALIADASQPPKCIGVTPQGRLLIEGGHQAPPAARLRDRMLVQRTGQLMYEASLLFPAISGTLPEYAWTSTRVVGRDGLMLAGAHRNFPRHLFAVGLGATGIAGAYLAARILLRAYRGEPEAADAVFGFGR